MKLTLFFTQLFILSALSVTAQRTDSDQLETSEGMVTIQPILHGTLALMWNDQTIYVDPYGGAEAFAGVDDPDMILITDIHGDHMNLETLKAIETKGVPMVVPQAVADQLPKELQQQLVVIGNGETIEQLGIGIEALPMYNLPEALDSRHPKGRGNGYLLGIGDKIIYISGDTEDIDEMRALENIDVAFVCMNLPYTMSVEQAADAVVEFKPDVVYPFHYRGSDGLSNVDKFKQIVEGENENIEVRLRAWYPSN
ncbi:MAG: MBL fold metallo-hydrolase [Tunicatimonas sp.]|uniref:MBL fold metallo-hydrolase n=1 Tax=Tunicatimonas sp. TaxID=1940096 RepID=UPI003C719E81